MNRARVEIFNKTYRVTDTTQPFSLNVRNYDACNLPPCQSELRQHLLRTKYIACLGRNAHFRLVSDMSPTDFGWKNVEGKLEMNWFTGKQIPDLYEDIVISPDIFGDISFRYVFIAVQTPEKKSKLLLNIIIISSRRFPKF